MNGPSAAWTRGIVAALAVGLAVGAAPAAIAAPARVSPVVSAGAATALDPGALTIEPATWTASPDVTLHLEPPANADSVVRLSNDSATWLELPYAATVAWSLIDPTTGGVDVDGLKQVWVQYGDGVDWHVEATATVSLDRVAPAAVPAGVTLDGRLWQGPISFEPADASDVAGYRLSLDGTLWQPWRSGKTLDLWPVPGAGTWWATGHRSLWVQVRDAAGNTGDSHEVTATVTAPDFPSSEFDENIHGVSFTTPNAAITGRPFTIKVNYPAGYTLPSNAWCHWLILWGDDASIMSNPNPTWGELLIERPKSTGVCNQWTFTIPYRTARQFSWMLTVGTKNANTMPMEWSGGIYDSSNGASQIFRALDDSHDERFLTSTEPFAYVLPEQSISQKGDPVTYRLHTVGTSTVPQSGLWWTDSLDHPMNPDWSQSGGNTFTYTPNADGPWITGWTGVMNRGYMRSQYDPLVDGRAPAVGGPTVKLRASAFGTVAPASISWSGSDKGTGVYWYVLQVSRNGSAWQTVTLPSRLTKSISRSLGLSGTYRFRVRARDRVGNWSTWKTGPPIRAVATQESNSSIAWTGSWTKITDAALSGGTARSTTSPTATARISAYARSLAWVSRRGPGRGLAQVWVDGMLAATVDLGAPTLGGKATVFARSWSTPATHTLRVVPLGTAGRPLVEVDAFLIVR